MKAACTKCGHAWNVSVHRKIGKKGYVCPRCSNKNALLVIGFIASCLSVPELNRVVNEFRGYNAVGGEALFPFLYLAIYGVIREFKSLIKEKALLKSAKL